MPKFDKLRQSLSNRPESLVDIGKELDVNPGLGMDPDSILGQFLSKSAPAARESVSSALKGESPMEGLKRGWESPETASSGYDIASQVGDKTGIDNPAALAALSAVAEVGIDPANINPFGAMGTVGKRMARFGDIEAPIRSAAEAQAIKQALVKEGRISKDVIPELEGIPLPEVLRRQAPKDSPVGLPSVKRQSRPEDLFGEDELDAVRSQFPSTQAAEGVQMDNELFKSLRDKLRSN